MDCTEIKTMIENKRSASTAGRSLLVGLSGIDASGKGYIAGRLATALEKAGLRVALINVDGWLNLPDVRFQPQQNTPLLVIRGADASSAAWCRKACSTPAGTHFYNHALRLDEMFERLILPLKRNREVNLTMNFADETATQFRPYTCSFVDIDIILLEGIFIFKREFVDRFDLRIWVECSFETAMRRAVARSQEGLGPEKTIMAYEKTYFPAQRLHFALDAPASSADLIIEND